MLMLTVNGESEIGSVMGGAMAASEEPDPVPSVVPEGGKHAYKREKRKLTADNLFDRLTNHKHTEC